MLEHPLTQGLDLDDPATTEIRRRIIREKPFLRQLYTEWYEALLREVPASAGRIVELGSGAGFLNEICPEVVSTDILEVGGLGLVADAGNLPLPDASLRGVLMVNVFHHLPDIVAFLCEAERVLRAGGTLAMIEPWPSPWSRLVYSRFHHEPFDTEVPDWELEPGSPLTEANGALPWIVFCRDIRRFKTEFPRLRIRTIRVGTPFRYLLSGGVSMRSLVPGWSFPVISAAERLLPLKDLLAMFALIVVERVLVDVRG